MIGWLILMSLQKESLSNVKEKFMKFLNKDWKPKIAGVFDNKYMKSKRVWDNYQLNNTFKN